MKEAMSVNNESLEVSSIVHLALVNDLWALVEFSNGGAVVLSLESLKRVALEDGLSAASNVQLLIPPGTVQ